jgi:hypothetical protein
VLFLLVMQDSEEIALVDRLAARFAGEKCSA